MSNIAASNGKRMQCAVDIKSLQHWSAGVSNIPYMVDVAEELLRLATFTTEFDIKAVIADRATYCEKWCVNMCRRIYAAPRMSLFWAAESSDMVNNPGQTFNIFQRSAHHQGGWFHISCELVDLQARRG